MNLWLTCVECSEMMRYIVTSRTVHLWIHKHNIPFKTEPRGRGQHTLVVNSGDLYTFLKTYQNGKYLSVLDIRFKRDWNEFVIDFKNRKESYYD